MNINNYGFIMIVDVLLNTYIGYYLPDNGRFKLVGAEVHNLVGDFKRWFSQKELGFLPHMNVSLSYTALMARMNRISTYKIERKPIEQINKKLKEIEELVFLEKI